MESKSKIFIFGNKTVFPLDILKLSAINYKLINCSKINGDRMNKINNSVIFIFVSKTH